MQDQQHSPAVRRPGGELHRGTPRPARRTPPVSSPPARPSTPPPPPRRRPLASTQPPARCRRRRGRTSRAVAANVCGAWTVRDSEESNSEFRDGWMEMECFYLLDLVPHVRRRELAGAGQSHREGRADVDRDVVRLQGCDRERHRRVPARRPALASVSSQHRHLQKRKWGIKRHHG